MRDVERHISRLVVAFICAFGLASCDGGWADTPLEEEQEFVTPEEKKALEKFGDRLPES